MSRILYPKETNKQLTIEEVEELELTLINQNKMQDDEIIRLDDQGNWVIYPLPHAINNMNINLTEPTTELSGESSGNSNTIYSTTKTSSIGQPIRESYRDYRGEIEDFKPRGKRVRITSLY